MTTKNKYLFKNTIIFGIGNFATKLISFLLVPLYTNVMNVEQFGVVDLLYTISMFLIPLVTLNISESVLRFSLDKENNSNKISTIMMITLLFTSVSSLMVVPILKIFPNYSNYSFLFYFYLITTAFSQIFLYNLKGKEKLKLYSFGNFIYAFFIAVLNILFLKWMNFGVVGYFLSYIISNIIILIYSLVFGNIIKDFTKFEFDKKLFIKMIKYSIVLIPTSFMWWIINFMDRVMITSILGLEENGIYAISYKIPTILTVISSIFTQAWLFSAIKEKDSEDIGEYTNTLFNFLAFGLIIIANVLTIVIKPLFSIYVSADYFVAWKYVPFLMIGYIFLTLSTFVSTSYNVNKDSKGLLISASIGAIVNVILNFIMIPTLGLFGATFATIISYFCVFVYRIINIKKYILIKIDFRFLLSIILSVFISILIYFDEIIFIILQILLLFIIIIIHKKKLISIFKKIKFKS